jgi:hypothetical protein
MPDITKGLRPTHVPQALRQEAAALNKEPISHQFDQRRAATRSAAATSIQRLARGNAGRKAAATARAEREEETKRSVAATAIQRMARGGAVRKAAHQQRVDTLTEKVAANKIQGFFTSTKRKREREYKVRADAFEIADDRKGVVASMMQGIRYATYRALPDDKVELKAFGHTVKMSTLTKSKYDDRVKANSLASQSVKQALNDNKSLNPDAQKSIEDSHRRENVATGLKIGGTVAAVGITAGTQGTGAPLAAAVKFAATEGAAVAEEAAAGKHGEAAQQLRANAAQQTLNAVTPEQHMQQKLTEHRADIEDNEHERWHVNALNTAADGAIGALGAVDPSGTVGQVTKAVVSEATRMAAGQGVNALTGHDPAKFKRDDQLTKQKAFRQAERIAKSRSGPAQV